MQMLCCTTCIDGSAAYHNAVRALEEKGTEGKEKIKPRRECLCMQVLTRSGRPQSIGDLEKAAAGTVLCCAVLCCAVLCCAVLCCAVLCRAVPCRAVPCRAVLCCAVAPCCAVLRRAVPCHAFSRMYNMRINIDCQHENQVASIHLLLLSLRQSHNAVSGGSVVAIFSNDKCTMPTLHPTLPPFYFRPQPHPILNMYS